MKEFLKVQPTHSQRNANYNSNVIVFVIYYMCKDSRKLSIGDSWAGYELIHYRGEYQLVQIPKG